MSINMTTNVRWKIVLNATSAEWHELQHGIANHMADEFIYSINLGQFKRFTILADGENEYEVWARRDSSADVEFAVFHSAQSITREASV